MNELFTDVNSILNHFAEVIYPFKFASSSCDTFLPTKSLLLNPVSRPFLSRNNILIALKILNFSHLDENVILDGNNIISIIIINDNRLFLALTAKICELLIECEYMLNLYNKLQDYNVDEL